MAHDKESSFKLNLDTLQFLEKALEAKGAISEIGETKNLSGLIAGLKEATLIVGVLGAAFLIVKTTLESIFDAEKIKEINSQFEAIAGSSGILADNLKRTLIESAGGLINDPEILKTATRGMIELGDSAGRVSDIFKIAMTLTKSFGGSAIDNFENLNLAIARGNTRALAHMGIVVNTEVAYIKYAKATHQLVTELTEKEKKEALLNEVSRKAELIQKSIGETQKQATNTWKQFIVTMTQVKETVILAWERIAGPTVTKILKLLKEDLEDLSNRLKFKLSEGAEAAEGRMNYLKKKIIETKEELKDVSAGHVGLIDRLIGVNSEDKIATVRAQLMAFEREQAMLEVGAGAKEKTKEEVEAEKEAADERVRVSKIEAAKKLEIHEKYEEEIRRGREKALDIAAEYGGQDVNHEAIYSEKRRLIYEDEASQLSRIDAQYAQSKFATVEDYEAKREEVQMERLRRIRQAEDESINNRIKSEELFLRSATSVNDQIASSARLNGLKSEKAWKESGGVGGAAFGALSKNATQAFYEMGEGTKDGSEIMKSFFLNSIADMAMATGQFMIGSAFKTWPYVDPVLLAEGGGLVALSGLLHAMAGGGGKSSGGSMSAGGAGGGGGGGMGETGGGGVTANDTPAVVAQQAQTKKSVNVIIQGNYYETEQFRETVVDAVRKHQDATDWTVKSVNER